MNLNLAFLSLEPGSALRARHDPSAARAAFPPWITCDTSALVRAKLAAPFIIPFPGGLISPPNLFASR